LGNKETKKKKKKKEDEEKETLELPIIENLSLSWRSRAL
jgi:hypothetical protein